MLWAATALLAPPAAVAARAVHAGTRIGVDRIGEVGEAAAKVGENAARVRSLVITTMSATGAAVGSGSVEKIAGGRDIETLGADDGKKLVRDEIGKQRAVLEDLYKNICETIGPIRSTVWQCGRQLAMPPNR
jgi:hypothetical protein